MTSRHITWAALAVLLVLTARARADDAAGECFTLDAEQLFDSGSSVLRHPQPQLERLARVLARNPGVSGIGIRGYTDHLGDAGLNVTLSQRRADAVKQHLVARGVAPERLNAVGMGAASPLVECQGSGAALERCLAPNRRVEVDGVTVRRAPQAQPARQAALDAASASR